MLTPVQMQRKRELRGKKNREYKQLYKAIRNYPYDLKMRDQLIAQLRYDKSLLYKENQLLQEKLYKLEKKHEA